MALSKHAAPRISAASAFLDQLSSSIDYGFQPIVSLNSGRCYGVEALMRGWQATDLESIDEVLDFAYELGVLVEADEILKRLAFEKFSRIPHCRDLRLFFNLDNRLVVSDTYRPAETLRLLEQYRIKPSSVVLDVSDRGHLDRGPETYEFLETYRNSTMQMALDDFGMGFSGLALLYDTHPEYVKIDRYFISDIGSDHKKKVFVSHVVSLAKTLGIRVVAEGVETQAEFYTCREIGCDLVQGYLIQRPTTRLDELLPQYPIVTQMREQDRRKDKLEARFVTDQLDRAPTINPDMRVQDVFESFRRYPERSFFPFIADNREPVGIIRETELTEYICSSDGRDLPLCEMMRDHLDGFLRRCPVADINTPIDTILQQYAVNPGRDAILIAEDGAYQGVLTADALMLAVQERNLELARDQNPLTGLPGNATIERFITDHQATESRIALIYFDLDNFKVFNDAYGFRIGDRALRMFADLLQKYFTEFNAFIGHIGGDDFFVGVLDQDFAVVHGATEKLIARFRSSAASFYDDARRQPGYLSGGDGRGKPSVFPLLSVSSAFVSVVHESRNRTEDPLLSLITALKEQARTKGNVINAACLM